MPAQAVLPFSPSATTSRRVRKASANDEQSDGVAIATAAVIAPPIIAAESNVPLEISSPGRHGGAAVYRKTASPLVFSLAIHAIAIVLCLSVTFATIVQPRIPLFASPTVTDEAVPERLSEIEIKPTKFDDTELQNTILQNDEFNIADNLLRDTELAQLGVGTKPLGDIGQLDALPSDLGALMAGAGSPGRGKPGGDLGAATFFGARSKGDRFAFVIDNSSSMKGGRLEMATAELLKTVDGLLPRQSFYVIFVSDQTYPMFYPQREPEMIPANPANKRRLAEWLPKAILASGKNRELIKAMDMAAALRPNAVYLLWDGDLRYSEKVRMDVMTHLTQPNQWNFTVHTLGMGITSLDSEQNLAQSPRRTAGSIVGSTYQPPAR